MQKIEATLNYHLSQEITRRVLPHLDNMRNVRGNYSLLEHTLRVFQGLPPGSGTVLKLAALLHDTGKTSLGLDNPDHPRLSAEIARELAPNLPEVSLLTKHHHALGSLAQERITHLPQELASHPHLIPLLYTLTLADLGSCAELRPYIPKIQNVYRLVAPH